MFPDVDTPFTDTEDVVRRLLPYHVLQQPAKDLQEVIFDPSGKGKGRAVHKNEVDIEGMISKRSVVCQALTIAIDAKFTIEYYRRIRSLRRRFQQVKTNASQVSSISSLCKANLSQMHIAHVP